MHFIAQMKPRLILPLVLFVLGGGLCAQNFMFTGTEINESQLSDFIVKVKKLNVGVDSPDGITSLLGNPALKTRQAGIEEWKYDFLLKNGQDMENLQKIENALQERRQRRQGMSLDEVSQESRENDDKYSKLEKIKMKLEMQPPTQVTCKLKVGRDGKLLTVRVEKYMQDTTDILYTKGDAENVPVAAGSDPGLLPTLSSAPPSPKAGQTYLNTSDAHFYGWNGKEWKQLDK